MLVDAGIDVEARTTEGRTALHDAIEVGQREIERVLLELGAEVDICAAAAMKYARDSRPFIAMLLQHGADVSIRTSAGKTAAEIAEARAAQPDETRPFKEIAAMLREV